MSLKIVNCPNCATRVAIQADQTCPACSLKVDLNRTCNGRAATMSRTQKNTDSSDMGMRFSLNSILIGILVGLLASLGAVLLNVNLGLVGFVSITCVVSLIGNAAGADQWGE